MPPLSRLKLTLALLCCLQAGPLWASGLFDAPKPPTTYSDRQQPMLRLERAWGLGGTASRNNYYDAAVAAPIPLYSQLQGSSGYFINAVAGVSSRFGMSVPGDLYAADYVGGISAVLRSYSGDFEAFLYRRASHLGDSAIYGGYGYPQRNFSRDTLRMLYYINPDSFFPGAAGSSYTINKDPASPSGRISFQYSFELPVSQDFFMGSTLLVSQEYAWALDCNFQGGLRLGSDKNDARRPALVLEYHSGASAYGQFYAGREQLLSLGIIGAL